MRRSQNKEEQKRIIMDLEVVMKCHGCPFIVNCLGSFISKVRLLYSPIKSFSSLATSQWGMKLIFSDFFRSTRSSIFSVDHLLFCKIFHGHFPYI